MVDILIETRRVHEGVEYVEYGNYIQLCTEEYITRLLSFIAGKRGEELKRITFSSVHNLDNEVLIGNCSIEEYKTIVNWLVGFIAPFVTLDVVEVELLSRNLNWNTYEDFHDNILGKKKDKTNYKMYLQILAQIANIVKENN